MKHPAIGCEENGWPRPAARPVPGLGGPSRRRRLARRDLLALLTVVGLGVLLGACDGGGGGGGDPCQTERTAWQNATVELDQANSEYQAALQDIRDLQQEYDGASPQQKPSITRQQNAAKAEARRMRDRVEELSAKVAQAATALEQCRDRNGEQPRPGEPGAPQPLDATLAGSATIRTNKSEPPSPTPAAISARLQFSANRRVVTIQSVSTIETSDATIRHVSSQPGSYDPATGQLAVQITVKVDLKSSVAQDPNDEPLDLTTGSVTSSAGRYSGTGSTLDSSGNLTLVAAGAFDGPGGATGLGGDDYIITVTGTISPHP